MKHIRGPQVYDYGYHEITTIDDRIHNSLMDFGILKMKNGDVFSEEQCLERAYLRLMAIRQLTHVIIRIKIQIDKVVDI